MIRLTSPVRAEEKEKEKKRERKRCKEGGRDAYKTLAQIPLPLQLTKKKKRCFIIFFFHFFFFKRGIHLCPSNLLPSSPRTLTRQRISRSICSLLTKGEWAAIWLRTSKTKKMQFKTERSDFSGYSHAPSKMSKATAIAFDTLLVWEAELAAGGVFSSGAICAKHLGTPALRVSFTAASLPSPPSQPCCLDNKEERF